MWKLRNSDRCLLCKNCDVYYDCSEYGYCKMHESNIEVNAVCDDFVSIYSNNMELLNKTNKEEIQ